MSMVTINCKECGKSLRRWPSNLKNLKYGPFCDVHCLGAFRTRHLVGEWAANYQNGFRRDRSYIMVEAKWHPAANEKGHVYLHRLLAEAALGRFLRQDEHIHHIDHDARNNHWSNLQVVTAAEHALIHMRERNERGQFKGAAV
jgi:predicted transcriptional regulator